MDTRRGLLQPIVGFHRDEEGHWVANLACGHGRHVRHRPPFQERAWTQTLEGRQAMLGVRLECRKCLLPLSAAGGAPTRSTLNSSALPAWAKAASVGLGRRAGFERIARDASETGACRQRAR